MTKKGYSVYLGRELSFMVDKLIENNCGKVNDTLSGLIKRGIDSFEKEIIRGNK